MRRLHTREKLEQGLETKFQKNKQNNDRRRHPIEVFCNKAQAFNSALLKSLNPQSFLEILLLQLRFIVRFVF